VHYIVGGKHLFYHYEILASIFSMHAITAYHKTQIGLDNDEDLPFRCIYKWLLSYSLFTLVFQFTHFSSPPHASTSQNDSCGLNSDP